MNAEPDHTAYAQTPDADRIQFLLQRYLDQRGARLRVCGIERISGGFETFIFGFHLDPIGDAFEPSLPRRERLILRIYRGPARMDRSAWERAVIQRVLAAGVPAPRVFLHEPDASHLGGPFVVLEFMRGIRIDQAALRANPLTAARLIRNFARAQAQIHAIDWVEGRTRRFEADASERGPLAWASDRLASARHELGRLGLTTLLPVVEWLDVRRRLVEDEPEVLIHGDYHPLNVFVDGTKINGIIDWSAGGFACKYDDIGWTSLLIATATATEPKDDRALAPFRTLGHRIYLAAQWEACGLKRSRLRYGEVYAGLRWMLTFLPTYLPNRGPAVLNDEALLAATPTWIRRVRRFIEQRTELKLTFG